LVVHGIAAEVSRAKDILSTSSVSDTQLRLAEVPVAAVA
jgi:hypothetical protein